MKRNFGHEDAGLATPESLDTIVENYTISEFLETNSKRYIVGPKGSGKTLLLLRKAIDQRAKSDAICIPSDPGNPVDRLTAAQHVGRQFNRSVSDTSDTDLAWASVWKHSIYRSVIHHLRDIIINEIKATSQGSEADAWSREIELSRFKASKQLIGKFLSDLIPMPRGPYYYYTELCARLDSAKKNGLALVREENMELESLMQLVRRPVFIFLDNLDDYYEREPELWINSMYGQFRAVREVSLTHRHIHVFTSIRRDVYSQFSDELRLQYYDYVAQLNYSKAELSKIFEAHIQELEDDLLMLPKLRTSGPWQAFFGASQTIQNDIVGVEESIWDYIHRHTLGRPRDLIHMGTVLLARRPAAGFTTDVIREAVAEAEEDIAEQYIAEVSPMLDPRFDIKQFTKSFVSTNVFSDETLEDIRDHFISSQDESFDFGAPSDLTRPFETLFDLGLLGIVRPKPDSRDLVQEFQPPGKGLEDAENRELPDSNTYLLHPVLSKWLSHGQRSNRLVVGDQLPYRIEERR